MKSLRSNLELYLKSFWALDLCPTSVGAASSAGAQTGAARPRLKSLYAAARCPIGFLAAACLQVQSPRPCSELLCALAQCRCRRHRRSGTAPASIESP